MLDRFFARIGGCMNEHGVIWLIGGDYRVEWFDTRDEALTRRRELIDQGPPKEGVWYVVCPIAIVSTVEGGAV